MSSAAVVGLVKRALPKGSRVGHMGTLDPAAAGVLPIAVGQANRLFDYVSGAGKTYLFEITLGIRTDTQDQTGTVTGNCPEVPDGDALCAVLPEFTGRITQVPSVYSALKRNGVPLYALARRGEEVKAPPRQVEIHSLSYVGRSGENRYLLRVECEGGTYVRSLCDDLGNRLGCGAHVSFLLRERSGFFRLADALTPEAFLRACGEDRFRLCPMDAPLGHMRAVILSGDMKKRVENGMPVPVSGIESIRQAESGKPGFLVPGQPVLVYLRDRFAGIAQPEDGQLRFKAMLLEKTDEDIGK